MEKITVVFRGTIDVPVQNALDELEEQFERKGISFSLEQFWGRAAEDEDSILVIGKTDEPLLERVFRENKINPPRGFESLAIHSCNLGGSRKALVVSGEETVGLMYAIYELADRVRCEEPEVFFQDMHVDERPENRVRGVDRYFMSHLDEQWFYSFEFWESFVKKLAQNRFNRFTLITGFDTAYMTPPYPFFVEVPGFENITVKGLDEEKRGRNLQTLQAVGDLCKFYGILFSFASWQQRAWTGNQNELVENLPKDDEAFTAYCAEGLRTLLQACPGIGAIQFRVNMEAGITSQGDAATNTHEAFWYALIDAAATCGRPVKLDLRAKGVTDSMIERALLQGLDLSIPTKYWCEHAALPYHISKLRAEEMLHLENMNSSRRYSYGDMLKKPHWYDMIYRLWTYGSINLFLWGDSDYAARFSKSIKMGDGSGFEINSPLALKGGMEAYAGEPWPIHTNQSVITYRWEDERYWAFYLVFGRYGYNSDTDPSCISREFYYRYGAESGPILKAYESASKVMPLITTVHFPVHPSLHYWPELYTGAALFGKNNYDAYFKDVNYASALPSDEELFYSIADYTDDKLAGTLKPKYSPLETRNLLHELSLEIRSSLAEANCTEDAAEDKLAIWVDFSMIAFIADFHAWKSAAAYYLYLHEQSGSNENLILSYQAMLNARLNWSELSVLGSRYYHEDLQFNAGTGTSRNKNWQARLDTEIASDIEVLENILTHSGLSPDEYRKKPPAEYCPILEKSKLILAADVPSSWDGQEDLRLTAEVDKPKDTAAVFLNYRHMDQTAGEYLHVPMKKSGAKYEAAIPGEYFQQGFDVIVYFSALDKADRPVIYPGINNDEYPSPYFVVKGT